ncbi:hypothetical protein BK126_05080 [Paenibacillus sp. FSL H7-0326]|uniref:sensor histidine kinase n=1 Tax=Paenibacillus sp. FSL H7-0326 TaxID=1921144 RepID=UPI00096E390D|nr:hypothetical protein [Paenibacillus sp. FSL H7-0326]OMC71461.1 hypothetical protein BK126_05080 [Paenibacillus sp. FSL H7-0326]
MIRNYLYIQHLRYKNEIDYTIHIPAEYLDYRILKLTSQPLVENAIYHGLKPKRAFGHLDISGYKKMACSGSKLETMVSKCSKKHLGSFWTLIM